jgi:hypothetical protein
MHHAEQTQLVISLCDQLKHRLLANNDRWPVAWNGPEIRWLLAKHVQRLTVDSASHPERFASFEHDCIDYKL